MTKTEASKLARLSRRYGFFRVGYRDAAVDCPKCRKRVECIANFTDTDAGCIDRGMVEHLLNECEASS